MTTTTPTANATNGAAPAGATPALPEAPAAASVRATDPAGFEWILTLRTSTAAELLSRVEYLTTWLTSHQWAPAASRPAAPSSTAAAPICPEHGTAMRPAKRGGWFCPVEVGKHPQTGKALYCEHRA